MDNTTTTKAIDYFEFGKKIAIVLAVIGLVCLLLAILLSDTSESIQEWFPILGYASFVLASISLILGALIDVISAKNDTSWKIQWGAIIFVLYLIGWFLYLVSGPLYLFLSLIGWYSYDAIARKKRIA